MLASMTPTGKRKLPFVHGNCQNLDSKGTSVADMKENLPVTDVPIPKRQCTSCHNVITGVNYSVEKISTTAENGVRSDVQRPQHINSGVSCSQMSMEVKYNEQEAMNNNDEMETEPSHNLCSRCEAGESGHIRHIFH